MAREYTGEEYEQYVCCVKAWLDRFGVTGWNIEFMQRTIGDGIAGNTTYDTVARNACFQLAEVQTGTFCLQNDMNKLALHEVLHLLLADLLWTTAEVKDNVHNLVVAREHELIDRLMGALLKEGNA